MKTRWLHLFGLVVLLPTLALSGMACGGEDPDEDKKEDAGATDDAADSVQDTGGEKDAGKPDAGPKKDVGSKDIAKPKKACGEALTCLLQCSLSTGSCPAKCQADLADGAAAKLKAVADCRAKNCAGVSGDTAAVTCAIEKCLTELDSCMDYGKGADDCMTTAVCAGACVLGDINCVVNCLGGGADGTAAKATAFKVCSDANCAAGEAVDMPACVTDNCATQTKACAPAVALNCAKLSGCVAKCPPSLKISPNHCAGYCGAFADADALAIRSAYDKCKEQCDQAMNPVGCVLDKCGKEQQACYTEVGAENCQTVYDCVSKDCNGIGSDPACIAKCVQKGSASAQDAYLHWEGCVLLNLEREEAETVGCEFPYDQQKCINYISGHFCGNQSSHCFTSN